MGEKLKNFLKSLIGLLLLFGGLYLLLNPFRNRRQDYSKEQEQNRSEQKKAPATVWSKADIDRLIRSYLANAGFGLQMQSIAVGVARLETDNYGSDIYYENNNLFGMKFPLQRETLSIGEKNGYANFEGIADSVEDYILYLQYFQYPMEASPETYVDYACDKGYFTSDKETYLENLKYFIKKSRYSL